MKKITGGVCAPRGFLASGVHCGIRKNQTKKDLALIFSEIPAQVACVDTQNLVKGAPIIVTKEHISDGRAQAILCNSGNANTCNADGIDIAREMCALVSHELSIKEEDVVVASTGVIGQPLAIDRIRSGIRPLVHALSRESVAAAQAIMTTDTCSKEVAVSFELDGKKCHIGAMAKGVGMIHPNMATLLSFITTDVNISSVLLCKTLKNVVDETLNMITVDGDTSTNDMCVILANGLAENQQLQEGSPDYDIFESALLEVLTDISKKLAKDGEGATKLLECHVSGAEHKIAARQAARSVLHSSLVKSAMRGEDANWGRVLCALGYSGISFDVSKVSVAFASSEGEIFVCEQGIGLPFLEEIASKILSAPKITIKITLGDGFGSATAWGCDLTEEYVKINADYRT